MLPRRGLLAALRRAWSYLVPSDEELEASVENEQAIRDRMDAARLAWRRREQSERRSDLSRMTRTEINAACLRREL